MRNGGILASRSSLVACLLSSFLHIVVILGYGPPDRYYALRYSLQGTDAHTHTVPSLVYTSIPSRLAVIRGEPTTTPQG